MRQVEELEVKLNARNKGMLEVSIFKTLGNYSGYITWDGVRGDECNFEIEKELEVIKPPYLAWGGFIIASWKQDAFLTIWSCRVAVFCRNQKGEWKETIRIREMGSRGTLYPQHRPRVREVTNNKN